MKYIKILYNNILNCEKCLISNIKKKYVISKGKIDAKIMLIGEAPGDNEDKCGVPFVGRAGRLLDEIIYSSGIITNIYFTNILKCRPENNRIPTELEINNCKRFLKCQINIIKPNLIIACGLIAANTLLNEKKKMYEYRSMNPYINKLSNEFNYEKNIIFVTFHPSFLIRKPSKKIESYYDFIKIKKLYKNI